MPSRERLPESPTRCNCCCAEHGTADSTCGNGRCATRVCPSCSKLGGGQCCSCAGLTVGGYCPNDPDYWNGPCAHGYTPYTTCEACKALDADVAHELARVCEPLGQLGPEEAAGKGSDPAPQPAQRRTWRQRWRAWLTRLAWPVLQARGKWAARRFRKRQRFVKEVAAEVAILLEAEKDDRDQRDMRLQIALAPDTWAGGVMRCSRGDGGCGFRQKFLPLYAQRRGDRTHWILRCPNGRCKKKRVMLSLSPALEALRKAALDEFKRKGVPTGPACREYQLEVTAANRQRFAARTEDETQPGPRLVGVQPVAD